MDHHPFHCYDHCGATNNDGNNDDYEGHSKEANADDNSSCDYDDADICFGQLQRFFCSTSI